MFTSFNINNTFVTYYGFNLIKNNGFNTIRNCLEF